MINGYGLSFHHFGLGVRTPERAIHFAGALGYNVSAPLRDVGQNVNLIWCTHPLMPAIEIIFPTETPGPLASVLQRSDSLIYHLCYECADIGQSIENMIGGGERVVEITPPTPAPLFEGREVAFVLINGFGVVELVTAPPSSGGH